MLTLQSVGFYSYMCAWLSPIPTESVDEVSVLAFFIVSPLSYRTNQLQNIYNN